MQVVGVVRGRGTFLNIFVCCLIVIIENNKKGSIDLSEWCECDALFLLFEITARA